MNNYCSISIEDCIHTRRCFMTGEYCAKQAQIQAERKKLHDDDSISAFVVMNFSNMSDVVDHHFAGFLELGDNTIQ